MSTLRESMRAVYGPRGTDNLTAHLETRYGVDIVGIRALDNGVWRVQRAGGDDWVARVFLPGRGEDRVRHDAALLHKLEAEGLAAERLATDSAVSTMGEHPVLVTKFIQGKTPGKSKRDLVAAARTLGRLLEVEHRPLLPGGALHHVPGYEGLPAEDLRLSADLLDDLDPDALGKGRASFDALRDAVAGADDLSGLPQGLIHPDLATVNQILDGNRQVHLIDWSGAGVGPRLYSIAQVLDQSVTRKGYDRGKLDAAVAAFSAHVELESGEINRLGAAARIRVLWVAAWNLWVKVSRGKRLEGNEWWLLRAIHTRGDTAPEIIEAFEQR